MAPNIRKVVAQLSTMIKTIMKNEKDSFYISYIEIVFFICPRTLLSYALLGVQALAIIIML